MLFVLHPIVSLISYAYKAHRQTETRNTGTEKQENTITRNTGPALFRYETSNNSTQYKLSLHYTAIQCLFCQLSLLVKFLSKL